MIDSKFIDSSIWIDYLIKGSFRNIIENKSILKISVLSLFEIKRKLIKNKDLKEEIIKKNISFIKQSCIIIDLNIAIAEKAAEIAEEKNLGAIDAIIYATAVLSNAELFTIDNDFRGLENVKVLA